MTTEEVLRICPELDREAAERLAAAVNRCTPKDEKAQQIASTVNGHTPTCTDGEHCPPQRYPERLTPEQNRVRGKWAQQVASGARIPFSLFL